jgi:CBS domain-containing protein
MRVRDIMVRDVHVVAPDMPVDEAAQMMADLDLGALPVGEPGAKPLGILTDRDILIRVVALCRDPHSTRVGETMSSELFVCHPDDPVEVVLRQMQEHQVRRMPVLDAEDRMIGFVTLGDLRRAITADQPAAT